MKTYTAIAERDGRYWLIRIPGLGANPEDGLPTQADRICDVEPMARDLIALYLDVPSDSFCIHTEVRLPESVQRHLALADTLDGQLAAIRTEAATERRAAVWELKTMGMTVRDIGAALGISYQRAQQLTAPKNG